ncbi:MAG: hypothetical protein RAO94_00400 [Candidatus Stygibacter australis]|nr:hypothetical protein [Candidatus Stygibacter australis]
MANVKILRDQDHFLNDIQNSLHRQLAEEEILSLRRVLDRVVRVPSPKLLDLNIPFWLIKRFYFQIYLGEDKRTKTRNDRSKFERTKLKEYKERNADYYFASLPEDIQKGFQYEEKRVIQAVFIRAISIPSRKILETNINFKIKNRYYLSIYLGLDRRRGKRKNASHALNTLSFMSSMLIYLLVIIFVAFFAKTVLNYDLVQGGHGIDWLIDKLGLNK